MTFCTLESRNKSQLGTQHNKGKCERQRVANLGCVWSAVDADYYSHTATFFTKISFKAVIQKDFWREQVEENDLMGDLADYNQTD